MSKKTNNNKTNQFKLIDVDIKNGITFTALVNDKELVQHHFELNTIEKMFGGNKWNRRLSTQNTTHLL